VAIGKAPLRTRLMMRMLLTAIFAIAVVAAFAVCRVLLGVILLGFLAVSIALLVGLLREREATKRATTRHESPLMCG
jgi:hypothetical protein